MSKKIFSLPINPFVDEDHFTNIISPTIQLNKDYIYDFYATVRIPPFNQDSMGGTFMNNDEVNNLALYYQNIFNIPVTATFNNTSISPSLKNMEIFIENFRPLYERGLKRIIMPFQHWLITGKIQKEFPDLYIKNTILNNIYNPQEIYNAAEVYDFIYVDRNVMRDLDTLEEYIKVKNKIKERFNKDIVLSLLINEPCRGLCPLQKEHYTFNQKRDEEKPYFSNPISVNSCTKWSREDPAYFLKNATVTPLKSELDRLLKYFEVFKLHGRDNKKLLESSLVMINNYRLNNEELLPEGIKYYKDMTKDFYKYLEDTQNCKFQCWNCNLCDLNLKKRII